MKEKVMVMETTKCSVCGYEYEETAYFETETVESGTKITSLEMCDGKFAKKDSTVVPKEEVKRILKQTKSNRKVTKGKICFTQLPLPEQDDEADGEDIMIYCPTCGLVYNKRIATQYSIISF